MIQKQFGLMEVRLKELWGNNMISVCMATYNGEKYIREQLISILKQIGKNDEVIVSDDGSVDGTLNVIKSLNDSRIKIYVNTGQHGFTHNFENSLKYAQGDYIFLSDQDDIWRDNKVKTVLEYLEKYDLVIHDCKTVDNEMNVLQDSRFESFNIKGGFFRHLIKSRYLGCCMAFNRKVLRAIMPFPKNDKLVEHDIWIAAVGLLYFKTALIKQPLILYRRHGKNVSDGGFEKGYSLPNKVYRRLYRIICLCKIRKRISK